ncbi:hypothetical protein EW145_g4265 [Phellinidium pouzarii]|uniref:Protein kinase domain-containing protein n=1 Tax=Phellinidium pouzarii TaxID=167371 RepID=A0A4S4L4C4_9AGAM|nr:hypothetical protein EW145_g4265 [Phellinidium pouzarii]
MSTQRHEDFLKALERHKDLNLTQRVTLENPNRFYASDSYGEVYLGILQLPSGGKEKVAIKRLRFGLKDEKEVAKFITKKLCIWATLKHPNILPLRGFIVEKNGFPSLLSDWMENGSALVFVKKHPECNVARLILGIAQGVAYLHEHDVIHSDLKSENVLVSLSGDALITGFGNSRATTILQDSLGRNTVHDGGSIRGSASWLAFELLSDYENHSKHTKESDVWAFGMTVYWEKDTWKICELCWNFDPSQRPTMSIIVEKLKVATNDSLAKDTDKIAYKASDFRKRGGHLDRPGRLSKIQSNTAENVVGRSIGRDGPNRVSVNPPHESRNADSRCRKGSGAKDRHPLKGDQKRFWTRFWTGLCHWILMLTLPHVEFNGAMI